MCDSHAIMHHHLDSDECNKNELILDFTFFLPPGKKILSLHIQAYLIQSQAQKMLKIVPVFACMHLLH